MATIIDPPNSVWPNGLKVDSEGYVTFYPLGTNKVDISTITWPEGDKLISPFVYQNDKLVGFVDTKALTVSGSAATTMNYNHIEADFASISESELIVNAPNATVKKIKWMTKSLPDLSFINMADVEAENIETIRLAFKIIDNKLYDSNNNQYAILDTSKIETATVNASMSGIVQYEDGLFTSNLKIMVSSISRNLQIQIFNSDLSSLKNGKNVFIGCENLTTFDGDLSALTMGDSMFENCINLSSFRGNLSSLVSGKKMFHGGALDTASIKNIASTISSINATKQIDITIGDRTPNAEENAAFEQMVSKNWTVLVNGSAYTPAQAAAITTLDEHGIETTTPIPFYAKPEESDEEHAEYIDANGNFFNIVGAQFIYGDDLSTYGMFTCEADAAANMRLTKIKKGDK